MLTLRALRVVRSRKIFLLVSTAPIWLTLTLHLTIKPIYRYLQQCHRRECDRYRSHWNLIVNKRVA